MSRPQSRRPSIPTRSPSGDLENGSGHQGISRSTSPSPRTGPAGSLFTRLTLTGGQSPGQFSGQ
eukprot:12269272-Prorocentrum_lima.AAC.1